MKNRDKIILILIALPIWFLLYLNLEAFSKFLTYTVFRLVPG